jgi:hypothetical protein
LAKTFKANGGNKMELQNTEQEQGLKRILVKFVGGFKEPQEVYIGPGTTASDLLKELKLDTKGFFLNKGTNDTTFGVDEALYPSLDDGDLVYVSSHIEAGN